MVVFRSMIFVATPPTVSMDSVSGVTSISNSPSPGPASISPPSRPACSAAPSATHSSGFRDFDGSSPVIRMTLACTAGMRVDPPTSSTWSRSLAESRASLRALRTGSEVRSIKSAHSSSNFARVSTVCMCSGPASVVVMNGRLISVCFALESSFFAFSASSRRRCIATRSFVRSTPCSALHRSASQLTMRSSKSSPPRKLSPQVESTCTMPSPMRMSDTSNVPPPKS